MDSLTLPNKQTITKPNPELVSDIVETIKEVIKAEPLYPNQPEIIYLCVKERLRHDIKQGRVDLLSEAIFPYYLNCYVQLKSPTLDDGTNKPVNLSSQEGFMLCNQAALSIFDLYLDRPSEAIVRRLLPTAAKALHEVASIRFMYEPAKQTMGYLTMVALLANTIHIYIRDKNRYKNCLYITWLKSFFEQLLSADSLTYLENDLHLTNVVNQIQAKDMVIWVTPPVTS